MAGGLFATDTPTTLEDALGSQAKAQSAQAQDAYTQSRKRLVSQLASNGQLMGGTADYPLGDLATQGAQDQSNIYSNLADSLGSIPAEDTTNQNDYNRNLQLAKLVASYNKPSQLQEALGTLGTATHIFCGGYIENECVFVDIKTGDKGVMAESGPELVIRLDTLGLTKEDVRNIGLDGTMAGFDEKGVTDDKIRELVRMGLNRL